MAQAFLFLSTFLLRAGAQDSTAIPSDHRISAQGRLTAVDLRHGVGFARMSLSRTWGGKDTLHAHFGPGWGDDNVVRLRFAGRDTILLWRGGRGWRAARRAGDRFECAGVGALRRTDQGWVLEEKRGAAWHFDASGRLRRHVSAVGRSRAYLYDGKGNLLTITERAGNVLRYGYDEAGKRVVRVEGPEGLHATFSYDESGRLAEAVNSRGIRIQYRYDTQGELAAAEDPFGGSWSPSNPDRNRDATLPRPFDPASRIRVRPGTKRLEARGWAHLLERDDQGRIASLVAPNGKVAYSYDRFGRVVAEETAGRGRVEFRYNALDLILEIRSSTGRWEKFSYDPFGRVRRTEASTGFREEVDYDDSGRVKTRRRSPSLETHYTYDPFGRLVRERASDGRTIEYTYDAHGRLVSGKDGGGATRSWDYDEEGRLIRSIAAGGLETHYRREDGGKTFESEDAVYGKRVSRRGEGWSSIEKQGLGRWFFQGAEGRPSSVTDPGGRTVLYRYNPRGVPVEVVSRSGSAWRYLRDDADRLVRIEGPARSSHEFRYSPSGLLQAVRRSGTQWRTYAHDAHGRIVREGSPSGLAAEFKFDERGELAEIRLPEGAVRYEYDGSGRTKLLRGPGYEMEHSHFGDGTPARRVVRPAGMDLRYLRDEKARPSGMDLNGLRVTYLYDGRSQIDRIALPGGEEIRLSRDPAGRVVGLQLGKNLRTTIEYDRADRITLIKTERVSGPVLFEETYRYDLSGNLRVIGASEGKEIRLDYDAEDRLTGAGDLRFRYDPEGSLLEEERGAEKKEWSLDDRGRPVAEGESKYEWDASGNLVAMTKGTDREENRFDAAGRLTRRSSGGGEWEYRYLPNGDRLWTKGKEGKTWYLYDDGGLVAWKDSEGVSRLVVTLPGSNLPLAICDSKGGVSYASADRLGSLRRLFEPSGRESARFRFGPYGRIEERSGAAPIALFAGMVVDAAGLHYARRRYYDPRIARFISIDPEIGSAEDPQTHHPYSYALNNPYRYRDPGGTSPQEGWGYDRRMFGKPTEWVQGAPRPPQAQPPLPQSGPGIFGRLGRGARWMARGAGRALLVAGAVVGAIEIGRAGYEGYQLRQAREREERNRRQAEEQGAQLLRFVRESRDPNSPRHRLIDRSQPEERTDREILDEIDANIRAGRRPLHGIMRDPIEVGREEERKKRDAALAELRRLLEKGHALANRSRAATDLLRDKETEVRSKADAAARMAREWGPRCDRAAKAPEAASAMREKTRALLTRIEELDLAYQALFEVSRRAAVGAKQVCEMARRAPDSTPEQVRAWKDRAAAWLAKIEKEYGAARKKVEGMRISLADFFAAMRRVESLKRDLVDIGRLPPSAARAALDRAKAAAAEAEKARAEADAAAKELQTVRDRAESLGGPYRDDGEVALVLAEIRSLGGRTAPPASLPSLDSVAQEIERFLAKAQGLSAGDLDAALAEAKAAFEKLDGVRVAGNFAMRNSDRPLIEARKCYAELLRARPREKPADLTVIPALAGQKPAVAAKILGALKFRVGYAPADRAPRGEREEGRVQRLEPAPGTKVERGSLVTVFVFGRTAARGDSESAGGKRVPDVTSLHLTEAQRRLGQAGLAVARVIRGKPTRDPRLVGRVKGQIPEAGGSIAENTGVILVLHGALLLQVPHVAGLHWKNAQAALRRAGFGTITFSMTTAETSRERQFTIRGQRPAAGSWATADSRVHLYYYPRYVAPAIQPERRPQSLYETVRTVTVPDLRGWEREKARSEINRLGLRAAMRLADSTPRRGEEGRVQGQYPWAGQRVREGILVTLYCYPDQRREGTTRGGTRGTTRTDPPRRTGGRTPDTSRVEYVTVPQMVGTHPNNAMYTLHRARLRSRIIRESGAFTGRIRAQNPSAGTRVRVNSVVTVYYYASTGRDQVGRTQPPKPKGFEGVWEGSATGWGYSGGKPGKSYATTTKVTIRGDRVGWGNLGGKAQISGNMLQARLAGRGLYDRYGWIKIQRNGDTITGEGVVCYDKALKNRISAYKFTAKRK